MNLVYYDLNMDIELEEERLNFLVIENPVKLEDFVLSIHSAKQKITV